MIEEKDREALIEYRLKQAYETIELVKYLRSVDKLPIAINRIYYGIYYALTALALKHKYETSKHGQLIGWFNKEFVAQKKTDAKYGKILRIAFQNRIKGDYDAFIIFSVNQVDLMLEEMILFIEEIKRLINRIK